MTSPLRRFVLAVLTVGLFGVLADLIALKHFEDSWQLVPLFLIGLAFGAIAWYLVGGAPTSAGLLDPSPSGVSVLAGLEPVPGTDTIALTVEPAGGLPQPTGSIVLAGSLPA